jgi:hypothetical protein
LDGGIILEVDGSKLASAVLLRDDGDVNDEMMQAAGGMAQSQGVPER